VRGDVVEKRGSKEGDRSRESGVRSEDFRKLRFSFSGSRLLGDLFEGAQVGGFFEE
jgi:hypothetical protein